MTIHEVAASLDGVSYRDVQRHGLQVDVRALADAGIVIVHSVSDDIMEIAGAVDDELPAWDGGVAYFNTEGLVSNECHDHDCPYYSRALRDAVAVRAIWNCDPKAGPAWRYETAIPAARFSVLEADGIYCVGIVFRLADVVTVTP